MPLGVFQQVFVLIVFLFKATFLKGFFDDVASFRFAVNGKVGRNPCRSSKVAQNAHAHAVNGAYPHSRSVNHAGKPFLHLFGGFVGESDGENGARRYLQLFHKVRNTGSKHPCLTASCACQNQNGPFRLLDRPDLFAIQFL